MFWNTNKAIAKFQNTFTQMPTKSRRKFPLRISKENLKFGTDLNAELSKSLREMGAEITAQYGRELNPNPTQLRYDAITDHSRNDVPAKDAVAQALSETSSTLHIS